MSFAFGQGLRASGDHDPRSQLSDIFIQSAKWGWNWTGWGWSGGGVPVKSILARALSRRRRRHKMHLSLSLTTHPSLSVLYNANSEPPAHTKFVCAISLSRFARLVFLSDRVQQTHLTSVVSLLNQLWAILQRGKARMLFYRSYLCFSGPKHESNFWISGVNNVWRNNSQNQTASETILSILSFFYRK